MHEETGAERESEPLRRTRLDLGLLVAAVAAVALSLYKAVLQISAGPSWDTYAFAANAAEIAGKSIGYTEPWRQPMLSILAAPLFRIGPLDIATFQLVEALVVASGVVALQRLYARRFSPAAAAIGAVGTLATPMLWAWLGIGYTDAAAVAFSAWALLFLVKATEDDPRWYLAAAPTLMAIALTRHAGLLFVFPAFAWMILRSEPFKHAKLILGGALLAVLAYVPAGVFYVREFDDVLYPFSVALGILIEQTARGSIVTTEAGGFTREWLITAAGAVWFAVTGLLVRLGRWASSEERPPVSRIALAVLFAVPLVLAELGGGLFTRQAMLVLAVLAGWRLLGSRPNPRGGTDPTSATRALDAIMLLWALAFADHYLHHPVKLPRYIIPILPGAFYFVLLGLQTWVERLSRLWLPKNPRDTRARHRIGASMIVWGGLGASVALLVAVNVAATPRAEQIGIAESRDTSEWLTRSADADAIIYSDVWPLTSWYLGREARIMPSFADSQAFGHELDKGIADYYVALGTRSPPDGFHVAYETEGQVVMERQTPPEQMRRILYLGDAWENYIESVCGYSYYLHTSSSAFAWGESIYLDGFTPDEMREYDAVAAYGVRWRDYTTGEAYLREYLEGGGTLVLDASGNLTSLSYSVQDISLLGTFVRRDSLPEDAEIQVASDFAARHPEIGAIDASPFADESGATWYGAQYVPVDIEGDLEIIASAGGKVLVARQEVGRGAVYWIGYNLAWHAFVTDNEGEKALLGAVFQDALDHAASAR